MKIKILNENDNKLFHRKEVSFNANHNSESTPTKSTIYAYFSAKFRSPKTNMILKQFNTSFGAQSAIGMLYVYDNNKIMSQVETKNTINRRNNIFEAEAANAAKDVEAQPTEKPIEVKSEESLVAEEASE